MTLRRLRQRSKAFGTARRYGVAVLLAGLAPTCTDHKRPPPPGADGSWPSGSGGRTDSGVAGDAPDGPPGEARAPLDGGGLQDASVDAAIADVRMDVSADGQPAADAAHPIRFVDVAETAGVRYVQTQSWSCPSIGGITCDLEAVRMTGGAAVADVDGDGRADLYVTRFDGPDKLYRNLGGGRFEDVSAAFGFDENARSNGAGFADIDNDGDADLYVTTLGDTRYRLYVNMGGRFEEQAVERMATPLPESQHQGFSVSFGDYDLDGFVDLHVCEWRPTIYDGDRSNTRLMHNRGATEPGYFDDVTVAAGVVMDGLSDFGTWAFSSTFSDLDADGHVDLAVAADFGTSRLFWNDGDGTFSDGTEAAGVGTDENGMGSAIGDYDGDGWLDWFVTSIFDRFDTCAESGLCAWGTTGNRLFRNEGNRTFSDTTDIAGVRMGDWGWGTTFFDYDNDGDLDLVMTNGISFPLTEDDVRFNRTPMRLWENVGGWFEDVTAAVGLLDVDDGKGLLVFDYDEDGDQDIFVANHASAPRLYRNDGGNRNAWLRVELEGSVTNRDALGARVFVTRRPGAPPMVREMRGGSNYLGQDEPVAHFGLGPSTDPVAEVRVVWPVSGVEQVVTDIGANQTLRLVEPFRDR